MIMRDISADEVDTILCNIDTRFAARFLDVCTLQPSTELVQSSLGPVVIPSFFRRLFAPIGEFGQADLLDHE